ALVMAGEGAKVVANDSLREAADRVVQEISNAGGAAAASFDGVATLSGGDSIIKTAINRFGRIDVLVNCAGCAQTKQNSELTEGDWESIVLAYLKGHFSCTQAAMPHMIGQKSGSVINLSSHDAFFNDKIAYASAQAGVLGFTAGYSITSKPHNVTVNAIIVKASNELSRDKDREDGGFIPDSEGSDVDPVAAVAAYLATDEAKSITGQYIYAAGKDICLYSPPTTMTADNVFVRLPTVWTSNDVRQILTPMLAAKH
ncbi:MAG: SDR family oxidoreductase, partial [Chloroflexi bacterium]|nr:SDR family oxidoreductase [Chloroflexota bacterium]